LSEERENLFAKVVPETAGVDLELWYRVPPKLQGAVEVGSRVIAPLGPRRQAGVVVELSAELPSEVPAHALRELLRLRGRGPSREVVELSAWAAWRWCGQRGAFLRAALPPRVRTKRAGGEVASPVQEWVKVVWAEASAEARRLVSSALQPKVPALIRLAPAIDRAGWVELAATVAAQSGLGALVVAAGAAEAGRIAKRLSERGCRVARLPEEWDLAEAAEVVVGSRAACFGPAPPLGVVVVVDPEEPSLRETRSPGWDAVTVSLERARRQRAAWLGLSATIPLRLVEESRVFATDKATERSGWALLEVVDRRWRDPREGLLSDRAKEVARAVSDESPACFVLNRRGRARAMRCKRCGRIAACEYCGGGLGTKGASSELVCWRCGKQRPVVCDGCGSTKLMALRPGVWALGEELLGLGRGPVSIVEADGDLRPQAPIVAGTSAALYRMPRARTVVFVDFDVDLMAGRLSAEEEALVLLARASRLVGGRGQGGRVVVQTTHPEHDLLRAVQKGDLGGWISAEIARRRLLRLPPYAALALVDGRRAEEFLSGLGSEASVELNPLGGDRWLVRAADHQVLCDLLCTKKRPKGLRVRIDPDEV